jgi:putative tryptophan/tyrosine transport system substrate-binding protein
MNRRAFVTGLGAVLAVSPTAGAQQSAKVWRIAYLVSGPPACPETKASTAFRQGLRESGFPDKAVFVDRRCYTSNEIARTMADQLLAAKPDVIVTVGSAALRAINDVRSIPIVFTGVPDPVGEGFVPSLANPAGNRTGLADVTYELDAKRLQILKEALPNLRLLGTLTTQEHWDRGRFQAAIEDVATAMRVEVRHFTVRTGDEIPNACQTMRNNRIDALLIHQGPLFWAERSRIAALSVTHRLPMMAPQGAVAEEGSLIGYGSELSETYRRAAGFVAKILKGAKPADLPVEQPTKFELVLNMKTAKALGLTIPPSLLLRADQVIE